MLQYQMALSSYLNTKADIAATLIDSPDPEARRKKEKTNADSLTTGSNFIHILLY